MKNQNFYGTLKGYLYSFFVFLWEIHLRWLPKKIFVI